MPPTFAASSGAVRRVHQTDLVESPVVRVEIPPVAGRSQAVDDVPMVERVVSQAEEMSTAQNAAETSSRQKVGSGSAEPRWHTSLHSRQGVL